MTRIGVVLLQGAFLLSGASSFVSAATTAIPPPTGHYNVGVKKLEIPYVNTGDPIAPNNVTTSFLATAFYPTSRRYPSPPEPYLDPATAALWEETYNLTSGSFSNLTSTLARNAPVLQNSTDLFPTLIFGPGGWGPPTEIYTILLSDLASHGYTVFGLDHPYEQPFVRYPNGTGLYGLPIAFSADTEDFIIALQSIRINETLAFIDRLPLVEGLLGVTLNKQQIGTLGHSLGGAAALGAAIRDERIVSGINLDGSFWGNLTVNDSSVDVERPVLFLGFENHLPQYDTTWATFQDAQTGWWRELNVNGSLHLDFSDETFWKEVTPQKSGSLGVINGYRQVNITRTFVRAFFDFTLKGAADTIFEKPTEDWPEVIFTGGSNGGDEETRRSS